MYTVLSFFVFVMLEILNSRVEQVCVISGFVKAQIGILFEFKNVLKMWGRSVYIGSYKKSLS
jgi:hypothetical protein